MVVNKKFIFVLLVRISSNIFLGKIIEIQAEDVVKVQSAGYQVDLLQSAEGLSEGWEGEGRQVVVTDVEIFQLERNDTVDLTEYCCNLLSVESGVGHTSLLETGEDPRQHPGWERCQPVVANIQAFQFGVRLVPQSAEELRYLLRFHLGSAR